MRLRFRVRWGRYKPGDRAELPTDIALRLIKHQWAEQDMSRDARSYETHYRVEPTGEINELANGRESVP